MLGFVNLFTAMSLRDSMKPQTAKQIQTTKFVSNLILSTTFKNLHYHTIKQSLLLYTAIYNRLNQKGKLSLIQINGVQNRSTYEHNKSLGISHPYALYTRMLSRPHYVKSFCL